MEKWQKSRNYRRIKDQNGTAISFVITVDGMYVEVTEEVFYVYAQADLRERYIAEEQERGKILSLEQLQTDGLLMATLGNTLLPSTEEEFICAEELNLLHSALQALNPDEATLIQFLFFEGMSERQLSKWTGIPYMTIHNRKIRILKKLKIFMNG